MKRHTVFTVLACLVFALIGNLLFAQPVCDESVEIQISPSTLNLAQNGNWVTVHVHLAYSLVEPGTVAMEGISADHTFADDCGDLVAKFKIQQVKNHLLDILGENFVEETVELELTGQFICDPVDPETPTESCEFYGTDVIRVINKGKK